MGITWNECIIMAFFIYYTMKHENQSDRYRLRFCELSGKVTKLEYKVDDLEKKIHKLEIKHGTTNE